MKIILVRYGSWENSSLTSEGVLMMEGIAEKLKKHLENGSVGVVSAQVARAQASAEIVAASLYADVVGSYSELYAADEEGIEPDCEKAFALLKGLPYEVVVAVVSREYAEALPQYLLKEVFGIDAEISTHVNRGGAVVIDLEARTLAKEFYLS